jgi:predicted esterase
MFGLGAKKEFMDNIGITMMGVSTGSVIFNPKDRDYDALKAALIFLKSASTAAKYKIDTSKITMLGISMGGNILASLLLFDEYVNKNAYGIVLAASYIQRSTHYHPHRLREWKNKNTATWPPVLAIHCENDHVAGVHQVFELFNVMDQSRIGWLPCPWDNMYHNVKGTNREQKDWFATEVFKFMTRKEGSLFDESTSIPVANLGSLNSPSDQYL